MQGDIKFFNESKGFGFITNTDDGKDYFVHHSEVEKDTKLYEGDRVEFESDNGDKGPRAVKVKKIARPEPVDDGKEHFGRSELNDASVQLR
jgi:cold shock protein